MILGGYGMVIKRLTQIVVLPDSSAGVCSLLSRIVYQVMISKSSTDYRYLKRFPDWGPSVPSLLNYIHEGTEWEAHRPRLKNDGSHRWIPHRVVCFDCMCQSGCCEGNSTAQHWQWHGISQCPVRSVTSSHSIDRCSLFLCALPSPSAMSLLKPDVS